MDDINKRISEYLFKLFVCRKDVYANQFLQKNGKKGFFCNIKPITLDLIQKHLVETNPKGKNHLGVYQLNEENQVKWGCLDFDINTKEDYDKATKLSKYLLDKGFHPLFEKSGGGDYKAHIWIFSKELISAKEMRLFLENVCKEANIFPHEIFPKQDTIRKNMNEFVNQFLNLHEKPYQCLYINLRTRKVFDQMNNVCQILQKNYN